MVTYIRTSVIQSSIFLVPFCSILFSTSLPSSRLTHSPRKFMEFHSIFLFSKQQRGQKRENVSPHPYKRTYKSHMSTYNSARIWSLATRSCQVGYRTQSLIPGGSVQAKILSSIIKKQKENGCQSSQLVFLASQGDLKILENICLYTSTAFLRLILKGGLSRYFRYIYISNVLVHFCQFFQPLCKVSNLCYLYFLMYTILPKCQTQFQNPYVIKGFRIYDQTLCNWHQVSLV